MRTLLLSLLVLLVVVLRGSDAAHVFRGRQIPRPSFVRKDRSDGNVLHEVVVAVKKNNLETLEQITLERATPGSPSYQQWLTYDEVTAITQNEPSYQKARQWLEANNVQITWTSPRKDYIRAVAPIDTWEKMLSATFHQYEDKSRKGKVRMFHRAESYSLPEELTEDIFAIFNTVQTPPAYRKRYHVKEHPEYGQPFRTNLRVAITPDTVSSGTVTVSFLNSYYNVTSNIGPSSSSLSQSVFETDTEYYSTSDLSDFQNNYCLTEQSAESIGDHALSSCPTTSTSTVDCYEGNLDIQYIMGVAQVTTSIFWWVQDSTGDPFVTWITAVAAESDPPKVNSISWGGIEQAQDESTLSSFNSEAMALAAQGVTITASSGDDGAPNEADNCLCNVASGSNIVDWTTPNTWSGQGYFPNFPASCPYVTSVGATQGPEVGTAEIACQSSQGGLITTGGGFSTYFSTPSWQSNAVQHYFSTVSPQPSAGYNPQGRGIPDISLIGVNYQVYVGGVIQSVFGTSCSSPVFAAFITLINGQRERLGLGPVGWLNPTLYSYGWNNTAGLPTATDAGFNDVTEGNNKCCAAQVPALATCCTSGFTAAPAWDPVTGWGSVNFTALAAMFGVNEVVPLGAAASCPSTNSNSVSAVVIAVATVFSILGFAVLVFAVWFFCLRLPPPLSYANNQGVAVQARPAVHVANPVVTVNTTHVQK